MVALANTALTAIGLLVLGIEPVQLLCAIVFICGLIPVLGTFISSVPIILLGINTGGFLLGFWALCVILLVHGFENYLINPRIIGAFFKISPVLILLILYFALHFFGLWGMLLGVPTSVFLYHLILKEEEPLPGEER